MSDIKASGTSTRDTIDRPTNNAASTTETPAAAGGKPGGGGAARGKVTGTKDGVVLFAPHGTNYELHLAAPGYAGPVGVAIEGAIRVTARKVWTVPSGGNFIAPIFGQPRTIQGRVRALDERSLLVQAGVPVIVELPAENSGLDLANGPITVGTLVNVTAMPGARFQPGPRGL